MPAIEGFESQKRRIDDQIAELREMLPGMFDFFRIHPWVLEPYLYEDQDRLIAAITEKVIDPADAKAREQTGR